MPREGLRTSTLAKLDQLQEKVRCSDHTDTEMLRDVLDELIDALREETSHDD